VNTNKDLFFLMAEIGGYVIKIFYIDRIYFVSFEKARE